MVLTVLYVVTYKQYLECGAVLGGVIGTGCTKHPCEQCPSGISFTPTGPSFNVFVLLLPVDNW